MSVFGSIMSKIFGHASAAPAAPAASATSAPTPSAFNETPAAAAAATTATTTAAPAAATPAQPVDVAAILTTMATSAGQPLNWRTSIVDLMKLLGLDSSIDNRRALASELHYTGDSNDSAGMNVWLHKQVMQKLAENGGTVPAELR